MTFHARMCQEFTSKMKVQVLRYYGMDAALSGEKRHPQDHLKELGVKYGYASCHSVADVWFFWMPYGNLDALPEWITENNTDVDPIEFWGDDNEESIAVGQKILNIYSKMNEK